MSDEQILIWTRNFNSGSYITNDWKMWYNGYNTKKLKSYLDKHRPDLVQNQTLRELHSPLLGPYSQPYLKCVEDLSTNEKPFYYPIAIPWWVDVRLLKVSVEIEDFIIGQIKKNKAKIMLYNNEEQWGFDYWKILIDTIIDQYKDLTYDDFVVSCNNPKVSNLKSVPGYHNQFTPDNNFGWWQNASEMWTALSKKITNPVPNELNGDGSRPFKFVCLLRRPSPIRWALSAELLDYRLKGEALLSMSCDVQEIQQNGPIFENLEDGYYNYMRNRHWVGNKCLLPDHEIALSRYPGVAEKLINYDHHYPFWIGNDVNPLTNPASGDSAIWKFTDSYLHVVSETLFSDMPWGPQEWVNDCKYYDQGVCLSEKIYKPIYYMQPFVVFGTPNTLSSLKEMGYKTFDTWIDESYDEIFDYELRFNKAIASVKEFVNNSANDLDRIMQEMLPVLQHNTDVLTKNKENYHTDFVKSANAMLLS